jgi:orotate phosphoribosyltransferase
MNAEIADEVFRRIREAAALLLWDTEAVKVNLEKPFKLVSGNFSPIYINCRLAISHPILMNIFTTFAQAICEHNAIQVDVVAGGETAGIPFASYVAKSLSLPMVYIRKARKDHGIASLIEGTFPKDSKVLLVEDLVTDGGSKLHFVDAIRAAGGIVENVFVLFDREQGGRDVLGAQGIQLHSVTNMSMVLNIAKETGLVDEKQLASVVEYVHSPRNWHGKMGIPFNP